MYTYLHKEGYYYKHTQHLHRQKILCLLIVFEKECCPPYTTDEALNNCGK